MISTHFTSKVLILALALTEVAMGDTGSYKKPSDQELRAQLTPEQYRCTQEEGTEKPFSNAYWNHHEDGVYVDVVSGEALFSSLDKYDSGTGWPSFFKSISPQTIREKADHQLAAERIEIRSAKADSHLGHVFDDGPQPTGRRYCVNSAALKFIPLKDLKAQGYGAYLFSFKTQMKWEIATLAGGCFWGMEGLFREIPGVIETQVGYSGGKSPKANYEEVKTGKTGHAESLQILFDPKKLKYEDLLLRFFKLHDPTTLNRQGNDIGSQYRSAIFYQNPEQKAAAERIKARVEHSGKWGKPILTEITAETSFVRAEEYHQKYLAKHPDGYTCHYVRKIDF
jgi:peptide methionine sulfoxide reductase msrA/msrB